MNLELPFDEGDPSALDEYLTEIDQNLDALFLEAVAGELKRLQVERVGAADGEAA